MTHRSTRGKSMSELYRRALELDAADPLRGFREQFYVPRLGDGQEEVYFVGNSLGLQPRRAGAYIEQELRRWRELAVRGHFEGECPWMPYHKYLAPAMARLVGAGEDEVVMMNSLTANLHLMMASFYQPTARRNKILIEGRAFPSDRYAVESQIRWHGYDPGSSLLVIEPDAQTGLIDQAGLLETLEDCAEELALILLPGVQYYTGQVFAMASIAGACQQLNIPCGFDLAHAVGNVPLQLHDWGVDFAVWCSYKYLNSGPGSVGGCFVHRRRAADTDWPRLAGWWGHDHSTRFEMGNDFRPLGTAEGWQLSNPPILSLAAIRASLAVFSRVDLEELRDKSLRLTGFLAEQLTSHFPRKIRIVTPLAPSARGCQLSLEADFPGRCGREVYEQLERHGVRVDWREPNVIRAAPVPLYNSFEDVARFIEVLESIDE